MLLERIDYSDCYSYEFPRERLQGRDCTELVERLARVFFSTALPEFLRSLLRFQWRSTSRAGKTAGWDVDALAQGCAPLQVGEMVGPWQVWERSDTEVILGQRESHLDFSLALRVVAGDDSLRVEAMTQVCLHNAMGRIYFAMVKPVHRRLVPWFLRRVAEGALDADGLRLRAVLEQIGRTGVALRFWRRGANNMLFESCASDERFVVKLGVNGRFRFLHREFQFLCRTDGIGPRAYALHTQVPSGLQSLVEERLDGVPPGSADCGILERIGAKIAEVHRLLAFADWTPAEDWKAFMEERVLRPGNAGDWGKHFAELCDGMSKAGDLLYGDLPMAGRPLPVIVHGDLIPDNMLVLADRSIRILDWEGARLDEPEADLATAIKGLGLAGTARAALLRGYGMPLRGPVLEFRLALHALQVAGWRLAVQLPAMPTGPAKDHAQAEACAEMRQVQEYLASLLGAC